MDDSIQQHDEVGGWQLHPYWQQKCEEYHIYFSRLLQAMCRGDSKERDELLDLYIMVTVDMIGRLNSNFGEGDSVECNRFLDFLLVYRRDYGDSPEAGVDVLRRYHNMFSGLLREYGIDKLTLSDGVYMPI